MTSSNALARKRRFIKFLKKCLQSGRRKHQLRAVNSMKALVEDWECSPEYMASFLTDGDLIEPMADVMSSLDPELLENLCGFFLMVAKSKTFFKPTHANYVVQTALRIFSLSRKGKQSSTIHCVIQLILQTLRRLIEQNVKLSHICETSQKTVLQLCHVTFKYFRKDPSALLNCCFVVTAILSEGADSHHVQNDGLLFVALLTAKTIKSMIFSQTVSGKKNWICLFSQLGFRLLRLSKLRCDSSFDEQVSNLIHGVIVDSLIPFLLLSVQKEEKEEKVTNAVLSLINEWLVQKKTVKKQKALYSRIAASGLFYALIAFRYHFRDNTQLRGLINSVIVEVVVAASENELLVLPNSPQGPEEFRIVISKGFHGLPNKVSEWSDVLFKFPAKDFMPELLAVLLTFCIHYYYTTSSSVSSQIFSGVCHCLRTISKDFPKQLFKILWFLFAVMWLNCKDRSRIKKLPESSSALTQFLDDNKDEFEAMVLHHQALLFWAFAAPVIRPTLQMRVMDYWLLKLNAKSVTTLKNLCLHSDKVSACVLNVLCSTEISVTAKQATKMIYWLLEKKPKYNEELWKKAFLVFNSELISELNTFYLLSLLICWAPPKMHSVSKLRLFSCLVSFWVKWETTESLGQKCHQVILKIILLVQKLLSSGASVSPVSITDVKFLKLIEDNMQSPNPHVCFQTISLFLCVLKSLPSDLQMEQKIVLNFPSILENISGKCAELSSLSIHLINEVLKPRNEKFVAFTTDLSYDQLRLLFVHVQQSILKNSSEAMQETWRCLSLVFNQTKKLESPKMLAHLSTHSVTPITILYLFDSTDSLTELFTEDFINFLSTWFRCVYGDIYIRTLLGYQRRNASLYLSSLYRTILKTAEKLLQLFENLELEMLLSSESPKLELLINVLVDFKHVIPPQTIHALKMKKINLCKNRML